MTNKDDALREAYILLDLVEPNHPVTEQVRAALAAQQPVVVPEGWKPCKPPERSLVQQPG